MINEHVVVDGSNIATEGRTLPSLSQLDEAVRSFQDEFRAAEVTVVVDATFGHRIDDSEKPTFEEAVLAGELVSPPAGAIGRGDAFVLSIANKAEATVFSNDSFQEFHGQYTWLFDEGRLVGGKPVPGVGWVFVLRAPVRGPLSRRSTRDARVSTAKKAATKAPASRTTKAGVVESPSRRRRRPTVDTADASAAGTVDAVATIDEPVVEATDTLAAADASAEGSGRGRRRRSTKQVEPINEPLPFLQFVSAHPVGSVVEGTVDRFSSHGAYVVIDSAQCYLPLRSMANPPPKSAKEVLTVGETRSFVVEAFESPRRSIDLAIPGFETVEAAPVAAEDGLAQHPPAEEAPAMASPKKAPARKSAAKKTTAKKSTAKKSTAKKKAPAKRATAKKSTAKKSPTRKSVAKKTSPAKKTTGTKKAAKKSTAATKKAAARKSTAKKSTAKRSTARKS